MINIVPNEAHFKKDYVWVWSNRRESGNVYEYHMHKNKDGLWMEYNVESQWWTACSFEDVKRFADVLTQAAYYRDTEFYFNELFCDKNL